MLMRRAVLLGIMFLGISGTSFAQVVTGTPLGTPPFSAISAGPGDSVDLANLNVHIVMPVLHKAGRGIPFSFDVTYDTSLWAPYGSVWITSGPPNSSFGWFFPQQGGVQNSAIGVSYCGSPYPTGAVVTYGFIYYDPLGTRHPLQGILRQSSGSCGSGYSFSGGGPATDGSGYVLSADSSGNIKVTAKSGKVVYWSNSGNNYVQPVATDDNGNEITFATSNSVFTDTLGVTALTLGGSGTPSSPKTFTYTAPSGGNAAYTLKYAAYTVKTNFGCSGISDYGPTAQNLPSELDLPDGTKYTFTYEATPGYSGDVTGRLASVTFPTGGTVNYTYTGGNNGIECRDGSTGGLTRQTPDGTWTYSRTLGAGAASTTTITAPLYNGQNNQTVMNFQGIYPTETQAYQGSASSGTLLKTTFTCYNNASVPCNSTSITLPITLVASILRWPNGFQSQKNTYYDSTSYGLVTRTDEYDYGSNNTTGALLRTTLINYASLTNGIVNKPASVTVCKPGGTDSACNGSGTKVAQTTYNYDQGSVTATSGTPQHVSISGSRGNPTTISSLVSGSSTLTKTFTYYDTGNVNAATDVNGAQTTYTYGACGNSFPTLVSGPLNLSKSMAWNCSGSVTTSQTDANNKTVSTGFTDSYFWRANSMTDPLSNVTGLAYASQTSVETSLSITGGSTADALSTLDILGRAHIAQRKQSPSATTYDSSETDYDALGRPSKTTLPYAGSAGQLCSGSCPATATTYDALNRRLQITDGGGGYTSYSYAGNDVYVTAGPAPSGENTKRKQLEYDGLGRLTSVCEITNATGSGSCAQNTTQTGYWTKYTYDANNNLTGVTQNAQSGQPQTRSYSYDDLGRMTSETNPESGTTTYVYDSVGSVCFGGITSAGDLVEKIDALGNTICSFYDALHRVTDVGVSSGPYGYTTTTACRRFRYDNSLGVLGSRPAGVTVNNPYGHLVEAETDTCAWPISQSSIITDEWSSYTARGETSDLWQSTPHSSGYYHSGATYWANGLINVLTGALGYQTNYSLDGEGRVYSAANGGELASTYYNPAGLPTAVNFASGDSDTFTYDPNTNRMTQYKFTVNGQSVVGNLTWNALGTLASLSITDPFNSANTQSCSYSQDDLVRVASANCGSVWSQTFGYDAFGNLNKSGSMLFHRRRAARCISTVPTRLSENRMRRPAQPIFLSLA